MHRTILIILIGIMTVWPAVGGWSKNNQWYIAQDAAGLMPENFRWLISKYSTSFQRGVFSSESSQIKPDAFIDGVINSSKETIRRVRKLENPEAAVCTIGLTGAMVIHFAHPMGNPDFNQRIRTDYDIYLEKHRPEFFIHWPGAERRPNNESSLRAFLSELQARCTKMRLTLQKSLAGSHHPISAYDNKSIPFGIGSMAYSLAVSSTAMTWMYIWDQCGGLKKSE